MQQEAPDFWTNAEAVQTVGREIKDYENLLINVRKIDTMLSDIDCMIELSEEDETMTLDAENALKSVQKDLHQLKLFSMLDGKHDSSKAIITIHAGAGGTEAQDWASMLYRMYSMYADKYDYKITILDEQAGDVAGYKSITFTMEGSYAYGYMKAEMGVHRLVRISPFDSGARRHTSFASVEVVPEIMRDDEIEIKSDDIRIDTYRSSGAGGQHVNKTDSAIRITHFPTGIVVTCQNERSQLQNKEMAFRIPKSKLLQKREEEEEARLNQIKGSLKKIEWGSQIRSYVFCPYTLVKDHRTSYEKTDIQSVMNGEIQEFIEDYLLKSKG